MRTAFKDTISGLRWFACVVEPHHDGNAALAYDAFCNPRQRNQIIEIMRRYALKEDDMTKEEPRETVLSGETP